MQNMKHAYKYTCLQSYKFEKASIPEDGEEKAAFVESLLKFVVCLLQYERAIRMEDTTLYVPVAQCSCTYMYVPTKVCSPIGMTCYYLTGKQLNHENGQLQLHTQLLADHPERTLKTTKVLPASPIYLPFISHLSPIYLPFHIYLLYSVSHSSVIGTSIFFANSNLIVVSFHRIRLTKNGCKLQHRMYMYMCMCSA